MKPLSRTQKSFCARLADGGRFVELFSFLPDIYLFCKDLEGKFIFANEAFARALGVDHVADILGKTDFDFFESELAGRYVKEDAEVMKSGTPVDNKAWLVPNGQGQLRWYFSSKIPLCDKSGKVMGIAGVMRDLSNAGSVFDPYRELSSVLAHVESNYAQPLAVKDLAKVAGMSVSKLERRFRKLFNVSPMQYVTQVRIQAAAEALLHTSKTVGEIALDCGFYDQSHFTRHFKAARKVTPMQYRNAVLG